MHTPCQKENVTADDLSSAQSPVASTGPTCTAECTPAGSWPVQQGAPWNRCPLMSQREGTRGGGGGTGKDMGLPQGSQSQSCQASPAQGR